MIEIQKEDYVCIAELLKQELTYKEYFNGYLEVQLGEYKAMITATLIIYRSKVVYPEGVKSLISDVVPVWWEFELSNNEDVDIFNDFSFNELRPLLKQTND